MQGGMGYDQELGNLILILDQLTGTDLNEKVPLKAKQPQRQNLTDFGVLSMK